MPEHLAPTLPEPLVPASPRAPLLDRLGRLLVRHSRLIAVLAVVLTALILTVAAGALNALSLSRIADPAAESDRARQVLASQFQTGPPNLAFLVTADAGTVDDPAVRAAGLELTAELADRAGVAEAASYWSRGDSPALRSKDSRQALVLVRVPGEVNEARARVGELAKEFAGQRDDLTVRSGGQDEVFREIGAQARADFLRAELIVLPMVLALLILIYRKVALALVTLGVGVFAVGGALAGLRMIAAFTEVSTFAANLALVMGLALGVDYCLFVIARYPRGAGRRRRCRRLGGRRCPYRRSDGLLQWSDRRHVAARAVAVPVVLPAFLRVRRCARRRLGARRCARDPARRARPPRPSRRRKGCPAQGGAMVSSGPST